MTYDTALILDLQPRLEGHVFRAPEGVALRRGPYGLGLVATRPFGAGEPLYRSGWFTVPNQEHAYRVLVEVDGAVEELHVTRTHSVKYRDVRTFDIPGCFMNHSCSPTSTSVDLTPDGGDEVTMYDQVALVDIAAGDPITCDYTLFDWDCDGHRFSCSCGAPECYGLVAGFEGLPRHVQDRLLDRIFYESARMWSQNH